jgi:hypothetical protein
LERIGDPALGLLLVKEHSMIRSASAKKLNLSDVNPKKLSTRVEDEGHAAVATSTKLELLEAMLRRAEGASMPQLMLALSWQKHSVRGAISGTLRKKKNLHVHVEKPTSGEPIYRILE